MNNSTLFNPCYLEILATNLENAKISIDDTSITYKFDSMDFCQETRVSHITFKKTKEYQTIERYVTRNYVRYPVYSDYKYKTTFEKKNIKLTNAVLEELNENDDELISTFAPLIIYNLHQGALIPSWLANQCILAEYTDKRKNCTINIDKNKKDLDTFVNLQNEIITALNRKKKQGHRKLNHRIKKKTKQEKKIEYIDTHKKSILKSIVTFGIYAILISNSRKNRILKSIEKSVAAIDTLNAFLADTQKKIDYNNGLIENHKTESADYITKMNDEILDADKEKRIKIKQIEKLQISASAAVDFMPLNSISGISYEKIIGCYIIRNNQKDKYYVGQSKDVIKRLKQHFNGTQPNNMVFAEDYYSAAAESRGDLFSVKIIQLSTKDELDRTEKQLIINYDSQNSGYNRTQGNS